MVVVTGRRHPHQLMLLTWCVLAGVSFAAGAVPPNPLEALMPRWVLLAWYWSLIAGGMTGLLATFWRRDLRRALGVELGSMLICCAFAVLYVAALLATNWQHSLGVVGIDLAWIGACAWRVVQLRTDLRALRAVP